MFDSQNDQPLYEQVARYVEDMIAAETYRVGDAIPSVRQAVKLFRVSAGTVLEAYRRLEDRGLIRVRPQSGYYVCRRRGGQVGVPTVAPTASMPCEIADHIAVEMLRRMVSPDVLQLGAAVPDPSFLPIRALNVRLTRAVRQAGAAGHGYGPIRGIEPLRRHLARFMADAGCATSPDDIIVTNGCTEALNLAIRAVAQPGDIVAVDSPTYYGLLLTLKSLGLRALPIESHPDGGMCPAALAIAARRHRLAAVVVLPTFANPTGACMPDEQRRQLVAWGQQSNTPLIEDDIYGELYHADQRPIPLKALDTSGHVLYCSSISKIISPGMRIGWCSPGRFADRVEQLKAGANPTSTTPAQHALADYLEHGGVRKHLRRLRRHYRDQIARFHDSFASRFRAPYRVTSPLGGHLLWLELERDIDTVHVFHEALKFRVSIAPGSIFSPTEAFRNCMRINCAVPWTIEVDRAIAVLSRIVTGA